jgi:hypothetical protein
MRQVQEDATLKRKEIQTLRQTNKLLEQKLEEYALMLQKAHTDLKVTLSQPPSNALLCVLMSCVGRCAVQNKEQTLHESTERNEDLFRSLAAEHGAVLSSFLCAALCYPTHSTAHLCGFCCFICVCSRLRQTEGREPLSGYRQLRTARPKCATARSARTFARHTTPHTPPPLHRPPSPPRFPFFALCFCARVGACVTYGWLRLNGWVVGRMRTSTCVTS